MDICQRALIQFTKQKKNNNKQHKIVTLFSLAVIFLAQLTNQQEILVNTLPSDFEQRFHDALKPITEMLEPYKVFQTYHERGVPQLHEKLNCSKHVDDKQCRHLVMASSPIVGAGHHVRAKTQIPIIGILTQPIPNQDLWQKEFERVKNFAFNQLQKGSDVVIEKDPFPKKQFIEASHVQFLESAGARVVPVDYTLTADELEIKLQQIDGIYIPGDSTTLVSHGNFDYTKKVQQILIWAQNHNELKENHFPIMGVGYGFLAMIKSQMDDDKQLTKIAYRDNLQINLAHEPEHTFIFDEFEREKLENILDIIKFYSDISLGITMEDFVMKEKALSSTFIPVASFNDEKANNSNEEMVAVIEGVVYPWFGIGYRIDKIQFNFDDDRTNKYIEQSREAVMHAQRIANLFVDEARLSGNEYQYVVYEFDDLNKLNNNDAYLVRVPLYNQQQQMDDQAEIKYSEMLSEIYYF